MTLELTLPAPAKLNLLLNIIGQRPDGYHNLQTLFQFIDYCDELVFERLDNTQIILTSALAQVATEHNLIYRAARLLQQVTGTACGARISMNKKIPMGAGLGGGSSNAATTLIGLNQLWNTQLSLSVLADLGLKLGADVPVFVHGCAAWAEGVGEQLTAVELPQPWFLIITPDCQVSTSDIFCHKELTRNTATITIAAALQHGGCNDCEPLARRLYPEIDEALQWLNHFADASMTGTGSSLFARFETQVAAQEVLAKPSCRWKGFIARGLNLSPLHNIAKISTVLT